MTTLFESSNSQARPDLPAYLPVVSAPCFFANDYDGMQGKTGSLPRNGEPVEGAMGLLYAVATSPRFNISSQIITSAWQEAEDSGGSFNSLGVIENELNEQECIEFYDTYRRNEPQIDLLYPDTRQYHSLLNEYPAIPNNTLTFGPQLGQLLKTSTAGIPGHVEKTDAKEKGPVIDSWRGPDGTYDFVATDDDNTPLALVQAKKVILVDDKAAAFEGLPEDCSGILLDRSLDGEIKKKSQIGTVDPRKVTTHPNLLTVAQAIRRTPEQRPAYSRQAAEIMRVVTKYVPLAAYSA